MSAEAPFFQISKKGTIFPQIASPFPHNISTITSNDGTFKTLVGWEKKVKKYHTVDA